MEVRKIIHDPSDAANELRLIDQAADYLRGLGVHDPEVGVILGTGLGQYAREIEDAVAIPYENIPGFLISTAPSHSGTLYYGKRCGKTVLIMAGRFHCYEGYKMFETVFPVRVMVRLGIKRLIITNAAGAIDPLSVPGDFMLIRDHINLSGTNPLIGENLTELGPRFPDLTEVYTPALRKEIRRRAEAENIRLTEGVYAMMLGPSFETPAEIKFLRVIGADAVGMSTVPEAIVAAHAGIDVVTVSCLTNAAAGVVPDPISSDHVEEIAGKVRSTFKRIIDIAVEV